MSIDPASNLPRHKMMIGNTFKLNKCNSPCWYECPPSGNLYALNYYRNHDWEIINMTYGGHIPDMEVIYPSEHSPPKLYLNPEALNLDCNTIYLNELYFVQYILK